MTRKRSAIPKHGRFSQSAAEYTSAVARQRQYARRAADAMERGAAVSVVDVVAMLRARLQQPWRGRPPAGSTRAAQHAAIAEAAEAMESGEPLGVARAAIAAKALRGWADALRSTPTAKRGRPPKIDQANVALEFEALRRRQPDKSAALIVSDLAVKYGVEVGAIKEACAACGDAARRHFDALLGPCGAT